MREGEKGTFSPIVFLTTGGAVIGHLIGFPFGRNWTFGRIAGPECNKVLKCLATLIAKKREESYGNLVNYIRTKIRFSFLKSILISLRGVRGKQM